MKNVEMRNWFVMPSDVTSNEKGKTGDKK